MSKHIATTFPAVPKPAPFLGYCVCKPFGARVVRWYNGRLYEIAAGDMPPIFLHPCEGDDFFQRRTCTECGKVPAPAACTCPALSEGSP